MDVSIAVSLIRGQMGTVVERAVNGAVETVLAETLRIVGVKFEELKVQVAALQRDKAAARRDKALQEKENDKLRATLRYAELKLKYYRQGVEEEIQHRASTTTTTTSSSHPSGRQPSPSSSSAARSLEPPPDGETAPGSRSLSRAESESSQVSPVPQSGSRPVVKEEFPTIQEVMFIKKEPEDHQVGTLLLDCQGRPARILGSEVRGQGVSMGKTVSSHLQSFPAPPCRGASLVTWLMVLTSPPQLPFGELEGFADDEILEENLPQFSLEVDGIAASCLGPGGVHSIEDPLRGFLSTKPETTQDPDQIEYETSTHEKKNFCLVCGKPQVKLARHLKVHKGHPDIAMVLSLKPSCKKRKVLLEQLRNRGNFLHNSRVVAGGVGLLKVKRRPKEGRSRSYGCCQFCHGSFVSTDLWRHIMRCPSSISGSSLPTLLAHVPPRQAVRPWPKDLRLYEEYKLRRNELQRRSINRRREREKNLPQPLLADLVRERREKTRLRVARWRAKRKLQAGLNQAQSGLVFATDLQSSPPSPPIYRAALGDAMGFSQQHVRSLHTQQHMALPSGGVVPSIRALPTQATSFLGNSLMPGNSNTLPINSNMMPRNSNMMPSNSNMMPSNSSNNNNNNNMLPGNMMPGNNMLPSNRFPAYIPSASSVFLGRGNLAAQHAVTTTSPQPHAGQSQHSSSLMDSHLFQ
ncbi:hypothetical protein CRUP_029402 [Coryphaenoides rupestris]|nr:hypothetical protein CRUP_029402 [Coryphaenoides rupestris]